MVFCDQYLRRRTPLSEIEVMLFDRRHTNWAGPVAMIIGMGVSIGFFANQTGTSARFPGTGRLSGTSRSRWVLSLPP